MTTPTRIVDESTGDSVTALLTRDELLQFINCQADGCMPRALPSDEGLDESTCYTLYVKVHP